MDKSTLIEKLNADLAGELRAIIQYITYAAKATGPYRPQLSQFFLSEVADEQLHAQFLASKIVALGGEPTTEANPVPSAGSNHAMLEAGLADMIPLPAISDGCRASGKTRTGCRVRLPRCGLCLEV